MAIFTFQKIKVNAFVLVTARWRALYHHRRYSTATACNCTTRDVCRSIRRARKPLRHSLWTLGLERTRSPTTRVGIFPSISAAAAAKATNIDVSLIEQQQSCHRQRPASVVPRGNAIALGNSDRPLRLRRSGRGAARRRLRGRSKRFQVIFDMIVITTNRAILDNNW